MKSIEDFLSDLRKLKIKLFLERDKLKYIDRENKLNAALKSTIAERKEEILEYLQSVQRSLSAMAEVSIKRVGRVQKIPLSFSQERLWFLDTFEPNSSFYTISTTIPWPQSIDRQALQQTVDAIVQRHESLRTVFKEENGKPYQKVMPHLPVTIPVIDLKHLPKVEREQEAQSVATAEAKRPFDLSQGPLFRVVLIELEKAANVVIVTMHHIISDGWSLGLFFKEFTECYNAYVNKQTPIFNDLPIQYADFSVWQRELLSGERLRYYLDYWREKINGATTVLELPADKPRLRIQQFNGAVEMFEIPEATVAALNTLCQNTGATIAMGLLAAFKVLLFRYTGVEDMLVGTPIANRNRVEIEGLIGFFVNTLIIRSQPHGDKSFRKFLAEVRDTNIEAYSYQELPFEKLVEELQPERDLSRNPLFQIMFVLQNLPTFGETEEKVAETDVHFPEILLGNAKFDLTLFVLMKGTVLTCAFEYSTDLFHQHRIKKMIGHYLRIIEAVLDNPDIAIGKIDILTNVERETFKKWRSHSIDYDRVTIIELFEQHVGNNANNHALRYDGKTMTYDELNKKANKLAHFLIKRGVRRNTRTGIYIDRSAEMVIAVLGVLKAGGAYIPLDTMYPQQRIRFVIDDAAVKTILCGSDNVPFVNECNCTVVNIRHDWREIEQESDENPRMLTSMDDLVYVIYTSGSTGNPKGVCMAQGPLVNLIRWHHENTCITGLANTLQFNAFGFDVNFYEIASSLCSGGMVTILPEVYKKDIKGMLEYIKGNRIQRLILPFSALQLIAQTPVEHKKYLGTVREIISTGEQLHISESVRALFCTLDNCVLENQYGPSETHVVTAHRLEGPPERWVEYPPIGKAIANIRPYVFDINMNQVPVGIQGELYIGGIGSANRYVGRPELTSERFIRNPLEPDTKEIIYKTGDIVRIRDDGTIEYIGRNDDQIKIRGFRIELGEIESLLNKHSQVKNAVVVMREDTPGEKRLVAYVLVNGKNDPSASVLRDHLKTRLPDYMIPVHFITMTSFPLMPSGKINRRGLPPPDMKRPDITEKFVAAKTEDERVLTEIWKEVLKLETIGINDNFFEIGGHSLLATQIISRINKRYGVALPIRTLFEITSISGLSKELVRIISDKRERQTISDYLNEMNREYDEELEKLEEFEEEII